MNRISTLPAALSAVALVAGIAATTPAYAATTEATAQLATQNQILKGKFAFSAWRSCVETLYAPGFNPGTRELTAEGKIVQYIESGVLTFNGAGLVSGLDISVTSMEPGKMLIGDLPVQGGLKSACKGTYTVNADRSYTAQLNCQAPLPNEKTLSMGPFLYRGYVDLSASTLTFSEQEANVQTVTMKVGGMPAHSFERVCVSNGTLVRTAR